MEDLLHLLDVVLGFMFGSLLSRAINGWVPFFEISVIPRKTGYRVLEVDVRDGVQTVRIEFGGAAG